MLMVLLISAATELHGVGQKLDGALLDQHQGLTHNPEQTSIKNDPTSIRGKKREALLDDVVMASASRAASTVINTPSSGPKWKKSDQNKDSKSSTAKAGRPSLSSGRGERKTKMKQKQKLSQISASSEAKVVDQEVDTQNSANIVARDQSKEIDVGIFTESIDVLDVPDGLGGQGLDIGSWLNVDDDALQDNELVCLEIPMDDLSELKLNF